MQSDLILQSKIGVRYNKMGIYIHWPYCTHICPYCDFNIYRARGKDNDGLFNAILGELKNWNEKTKGRKLESVYFGGGTPSLMEPQYIEQIINFCAKNWGFETNAEITLEANPNDGEVNKFKDFRTAGIGRLSLGVQSFYDAGLKVLGRFHSAIDAIKAAEIARATFEQISLDLIYARQNQSLEEWKSELDIAHQLSPDHISPYGLTIEANTAFAKKLARGAIKIPDDEKAAQFYELTQEKLSSLGYIGYEISNHARTEANFSRHNMLYWQSADWLGIGPGAHGRLSNNGKRRAYSNILHPNDYIQSINEKGFAIINDETLDKEQMRDEYYIMGLRQLDGIMFDNEFAPLNAANLIEFEGMGYLMAYDGKVKLTPKGRIISNYIIAKLLD